MRPGSRVFSTATVNAARAVSGAVLATLAWTFALAACSNGGSNTAPADAGIPSYQAIGAPCDPVARPPCVVLSDVCTVSECDPIMRVCVRVAVDGGPTCGNGVPPPACSGDCDASAGDAAPVDAADASDAGEDSEAGASTDSGLQDATSDAPSLDSSPDAPAEAGDASSD